MIAPVPSLFIRSLLLLLSLEHRSNLETVLLSLSNMLLHYTLVGSYQLLPSSLGILYLSRKSAVNPANIFYYHFPIFGLQALYPSCFHQEHFLYVYLPSYLGQYFVCRFLFHILSIPILLLLLIQQRASMRCQSPS